MPKTSSEKKSSSKKKSSARSDSTSPLRDLLGFILLSIVVFVMISLFSYEATDPSWNTGIGKSSPLIRNWGGILGSYLSDFLLQVLGYAAYLVPIALLTVVWAVVFRKSWLRTWERGVGFLLFMSSLCLLLALLSRPLVSGAPSWGGALGVLLHQGLVPYVGRVGAFLVATTVFAISLVLTVGLSIRKMVPLFVWLAGLGRRIGEVILAAFGKLFRGIEKVLAYGEKEFSQGLKAIRKKSGPRIPQIGNGAAVSPKAEKTRKAKEKSQPEPSDSTEPSGEAPSIPIVFPSEKKAESSMPQFHTIEDEPAPLTASKKKRLTPEYTLPDLDLLEAPVNQELEVDRNELFENAQTLEKKLKDFGVFGNVVEVQPGPVVTMYEFEPAPGVKVNQLTRLNDDLALALKAMSVRIEPIPGKAVIGIEVANRKRQVVYLKDILVNENFGNSQSRLTMAMGKDISGTPVVADLRKMPHLLVAGATGSGKSVAVNSFILSILYKATPEEVRMILVDPKMLELSLYDDIPHLLLPVVTDPRKSAAALRWAVIEMERRYRLMADIGVRNIEGYNKKIPKFLSDQEKKKKPSTAELPLGVTEGEEIKPEEHTGSMPYIVIVIDELADLMMVSSREVEESIIRLAQMARAAGIHLMLATQRPSVDVITGVIKANMPARISFKVSSKTDSRTILDANGAELLLGAGDLLFVPPGTSKLQRIHGAFVSDNEVKEVTDHWKMQGNPDYNLDILKVQEEQAEMEGGGNEDDEMYSKALNIVRNQRVASISMIQRKLRIGYNRAARIVERMEEEGLLAPGEAGKPREVIMSRLMGGA